MESSQSAKWMSTGLDRVIVAWAGQREL